MSHVLQDIYEPLSENGSDRARLLDELNEAVRCDENVAIEALEAKVSDDFGYDCDWCKEWEASWAWRVSDCIHAGADHQLQIPFHLWKSEDTLCELSLEVGWHML